MSESVLARLEERIALAPAISQIDNLFVDLQDARDEIHQLTSKVAVLTAAASSPPFDLPSPSQIVVSVADEVKELALAARERLNANALSTVGDHLDRMLQLLEG